MSDTEKSSGSSDEEESYSHLPVLKKRNISQLRHKRQKFCSRWEKDFQWLKADKVDECLGTCTICNKTLVCKKSHLVRHQNSFKHQRNCGGILASDFNETTALEFFECGKSEPAGSDLKMQLESQTESDPIKRVESKSTSLHKQRTKYQKMVKSSKRSAFKLNRLELLQQIDRERHELNAYYYKRMKIAAPSPPPQSPRDTFDLFFESVSASVKLLPPKLGAELKSRISQIVAEFELKAIAEREAIHITEGPSVTTEEPTLELLRRVSTETQTITVKPEK